MSDTFWTCTLSNREEWHGDNEEVVDGKRHWARLQEYLAEKNLIIVGAELCHKGKLYTLPANMKAYFVPTKVEQDVAPSRGRKQVYHGIGYWLNGYRHMLWVSDGGVEVEAIPWHL
jgi:hypothetical protein